MKGEEGSTSLSFSRIALIGFGEAGSIFGTDLVKVAMLLGGARAAEVAPALVQLGMNATAISPEIGVASAAATAVCQDKLIDAMIAAGVRYEADREFSWRALADALAEAEPNNSPSR